MPPSCDTNNLPPPKTGSKVPELERVSMKFVMIIWFAMGAADIEAFSTEAACLKRLDERRHAYERMYVIGCFPHDLIANASRS